MSLHAWHRQGPREPSSCATFMSTLTGAQARKVLCLRAQGRFGCVWLFVTL